MTGFLCALGSVCLQNKCHRAGVAVLGVDSRKSSVLPGCSDQQYCPVTMSVSHLSTNLSLSLSLSLTLSLSVLTAIFQVRLG